MGYVEDVLRMGMERLGVEAIAAFGIACGRLSEAVLLNILNASYQHLQCYLRDKCTH